MDLHVFAEHHTAAAPAVPPLVVAVDLAAGQVSVAGEWDREHAHHVLDGFSALCAGDHRVWTLEARRVTFCDAEGLRSLVSAHGLARRHGRELSVLPSTCLHRLVLLVGLDQLLRTPPPPAEVVADLRASRRAHAALAAVRELRHPAGRPAPEGPATPDAAAG